VTEVIDAVRRISGRDFPVEIGARRAGDPAALVADVARIRSTFDWRPQFEDLDTIVAHAFAWEQRLPGKRATASA
jgi:UDP-glucose 4-epimerase